VLSDDRYQRRQLCIALHFVAKGEALVGNPLIRKISYGVQKDFSCVLALFAVFFFSSSSSSCLFVPCCSSLGDQFYTTSSSSVLGILLMF
jgi:hypothetical protein